ncbi:MAG: CpsD/CapB family tyrosine-protein kinase [Balneolaceae bacterium]
MDKKKPKLNISEKSNSYELKSNGLIVHDPSLLPMKISSRVADFLDAKTISRKFYNSFNFSKLTESYGNLHKTLGVTSANKKEGKTHVAANMGVSLARAYQRRTVLVDLNFNQPKLHKIFGVHLQPGVAEALESRTLRVSPTVINNLYLMSAGNSSQHQPGIEHTIALREILHTLKSEFDFVIVDMCSIFPISDFPVHFINEIDGLITVVDAERTKKGELNKIYQHIDEKRFVGYVFNRIDAKA